MGLISIDENTLNDIADALREANGTEQTYTIKNMADGVYMIDAVDDWTWVEDKGRTRMHINVWDETRLTVTINVKLVGTVDWGDGSEMESYVDAAITLHTHTYDTIGKYVISLEGDTVQLGSACMNGDAVCQRYLYQLECGKNCTYTDKNAFATLANIDRVYFSAQASALSKSYNSINVRAMYFNGHSYTVPGYGFNSNGNLISLEGTATFTSSGLHCFGNPGSNVLVMPGITINMFRTSGNSDYFCYNGQLSQILHLGVFTGSSDRWYIPSYLYGTYYWLSIPSNCTAWTNSTSNITIAANGELHSYPTTPPTINSNTFTMNTGAKIYVPVGSLESYQAATNWSALADYMEEE